MGELDEVKVAFLVANEGIEQAELVEPWRAVASAGGTPVLVAPESGNVQAFQHLDRADTFPVGVTVFDARNRTLTSWPSLKTDIKNAGVDWIDREVEVCVGDENTIVSSRKPDDLPAFCAQLSATFAESSDRVDA